MEEILEKLNITDKSKQNDISYIHFSAWNVARGNEEVIMEILNMILLYLKENKDSTYTAELGSEIYCYGYRPFVDDSSDELDECVQNMIYIWADKLFYLAIEKSTGNEDNNHINELLSDLDKTIEDYKK